MVAIILWIRKWDRVSFNSGTVRNRDLHNSLQIIGSSKNYDSNGKLTETKLGLLKEIKIGNFYLYNLKASLDTTLEGSSADKMVDGALGNRVLNKFNIIYDLGNSKLYLEPKFLE